MTPLSIRKKEAPLACSVFPCCPIQEMMHWPQYTLLFLLVGRVFRSCFFQKILEKPPVLHLRWFQSKVLFQPRQVHSEAQGAAEKEAAASVMLRTGERLAPRVSFVGLLPESPTSHLYGLLDRSFSQQEEPRDPLLIRASPQPLGLNLEVTPVPRGSHPPTDSRGSLGQH